MNVAFDPWIPVVNTTGKRELASLRDVLRGRMFTWCDCRHAFFNEARSVRHRADNGNRFVEEVLDETCTHAGSDGNDEMRRRGTSTERAVLVVR